MNKDLLMIEDVVDPTPKDVATFLLHARSFLTYHRNTLQRQCKIHIIR